MGELGLVTTIFDKEWGLIFSKGVDFVKKDKSVIDNMKSVHKKSKCLKNEKLVLTLKKVTKSLNKCYDLYKKLPY